jgi:chaperonin cofactor prefoldin
MGFMNPMLQHNEESWSTNAPDPFEYHRQTKSIALWVIVAVLAVVLVALIYFGYRTVKTQNVHIKQMFANPQMTTALTQRADAAESRIRDLAGDWQGMGQRMTKLETRVAAQLKEGRDYADMLAQRLHEQVTAEMDSRTSPMDARLRQVEADEANQRAQLAQMESDLKHEISTAREEREANGRDLTSVRQQEESNAHGVASLSQRLDRRRIDFEMARGQNRELLPGLSLQIQGVNLKRQRYHGTLTLQQDQRTLWLRDQSVQEPVRFFQTGGGEPYELVVTDVTKKSVVGYLLTPVKPSSAAAIGEQAVARISTPE